MIEVKKKDMERWLAVGLLAIVILTVCLAVFLPAIGKWSELSDEKNNLARQLKQYERILAGRDTVKNSMETIKARIVEQGYFNSQQTDALASAELQESIKKAIIDSGGQLSSTQALPITDKDMFRMITVSVRMSGNLEELRGVLYRLESSTPLIMINQLDIRPVRGVRNRRNRQVGLTNDLNVNFQAVSFMRKQPNEY
ncbi:MAG: type II secretion system protein GspM [Gammaproteobacteria bacterium]